MRPILMSSDLVVKSNHVIEASYRLTLSEQRLVLMCVQQIKKGQAVAATDRFEIAANDFADMFEISPKRAYTELQDVAGKLYERSVTVHNPDPENPRIATTKTRWISSIDYIPGEGKIAITFAAKMIPYISMLEGGFTRYNLEHISGMSSVYGIRFYEFFKCWLFGSSRNTKEISIEDLKEKLELTDKYPSIKDFKLKVLEKAMDDINGHSDMYASYKDKKTGRRITHFNFTFGLKIKDAESVNKLPEQEVTPQKERKRSEPNANKEEAQQVLTDFLGMSNLAKLGGKELAELITPQQMEKYRKYKLI